MSTFDSIFGNPKLKESFNRKAALYLQKNLCDFVTEPSKLAKAQETIDKLISQSNGGSFIMVVYQKARSGRGVKTHGRLFARTPGAMQTMPRRIRQTLCAGVWIDLDFVNCHPVILRRLCKDVLKLPCPNLARYVTDRDRMLQEMVAGGVVDRDEAKRMVLKTMNGGTVNKVKTDWWEPLCNEFSTIAHRIAYHFAYKKYFNELDKDEDKYNLSARVMNAVLCNEENLCLEKLYKYLEGEEVMLHECSLIFDGLMIPDTPINREKISSPEFLKRASEFIKTRTGHQLEVKVKEFDEVYQLPEKFADIISDIIVIEAGNDDMAAKEFMRVHGHRLKKCKNRTFWEQDWIYIEELPRIKHAIMDLL